MYRLMLGERMTTADVARMTGLTHDGAYKLMSRVSRVVPLVQTLECWYMDAGKTDCEYEGAC